MVLTFLGRENTGSKEKARIVDSSDFDFSTLGVRGGQVRSPEGEHNDPIHMTSSFVFESAEQAARRFSDDEPGNVYSRFTNPTVRTFEARLALLEGAKFCSATASGMAAILTLCLTTLKSGDHVVASRSLFGSTVNVFGKTMGRYGVTTTFVPPDDVSAWEAAMQQNTRLLFLESPSNPMGEVADIGALSALAERHGAWLAVDNVACTPALQKPLELGAHVVVHSTTKYIDGQGRAVGGAVLTNDESLGKDLFSFLRSAGPCMSPFNAWVFLNGLETLAIRMEVHSQRALDLARWLDAHPAISAVHYPGLENHPGHLLAKQQQKAFGGVIAFEVDGGQDGAWTVVNNTQLISITANLGDTKSTITHPATTTHARITGEERRRMGIKDGLVRVSVGFEALEDIKADLERGLSAVLAARRQVKAAE
jgi:O-succinylhomoserine sulfhydrylase